MITESVIGWLLILISCLIGIYLLKNTVQSIQQDISELKSIKNKLVIRGSDILLSAYVQREMPLLSEYEHFSYHIFDKKRNSLYLMLKCENYSSQLIRYFADLEKSFVEIKVNGSHKGLSRHKDNLHTIKHQLYPYSSKDLICCSFALDEILELANEHNNEVMLHFHIVLKYGLLNAKCELQTEFSDKANLKILLNKENNVEYFYSGKLTLLE